MPPADIRAGARLARGPAEAGRPRREDSPVPAPPPPGCRSPATHREGPNSTRDAGLRRLHAGGRNCAVTSHTQHSRPPARIGWRPSNPLYPTVPLPSPWNVTGKPRLPPRPSSQLDKPSVNHFRLTLAPSPSPSARRRAAGDVPRSSLLIGCPAPSIIQRRQQRPLLSALLAPLAVASPRPSPFPPPLNSARSAKFRGPSPGGSGALWLRRAGGQAPRGGPSLEQAG